jgi:hypothetical protein
LNGLASFDLAIVVVARRQFWPLARGKSTFERSRRRHAMAKPFQALLERLDSTDKDSRYKAFAELIQMTNKPVSWVCDAWEHLLGLAQHGDKHQSAIGVQMIANLTKSDVQNRILKDLNKLIKVIKVELTRFRGHVDL